MFKKKKKEKKKSDNWEKKKKNENSDFSSNPVLKAKNNYPKNVILNKGQSSATLILCLE